MKHLPPSKKKLEQAYREGNILKLPNITGIFSFITIILCFTLFIRFSWVKIEKLIQYLWSTASEVNYSIILSFLVISLSSVALSFVVSMLVVIFLELATRKFHFAFQHNLFNFKALSPLAGIKKIKNELIVNLLKLPVIFLFICSSLIFILFSISSNEIGNLSSIISLLVVATIFVLTIMLLEYWLRKYQYIKKLNMDHAELRREQKEQERDPILNFLQKSAHQQILSESIEQRVKTSRLIIVSG